MSWMGFLRLLRKEVLALSYGSRWRITSHDNWLLQTRKAASWDGEWNLQSCSIELCLGFQHHASPLDLTGFAWILRGLSLGMGRFFQSIQSPKLLEDRAWQLLSTLFYSFWRSLWVKAWLIDLLQAHNRDARSWQNWNLAKSSNCLHKDQSSWRN